MPEAIHPPRQQHFETLIVFYKGLLYLQPIQAAYSSECIDALKVLFQNSPGNECLVLAPSGKTGRMQNHEQEITQTDQLNSSLQQKIDDIVSLNETDKEQTSEELNVFLSAMADKYKTPLQTVYTAIELIISNDAENLSDASRGHLRRAQGALQRMSLLTDDIIAYAMVCNMTPEKIVSDLNALVQKVIQAIRNASSENLITVYTDRLPVINGDDLLLTNLFTQIIQNCIKFRKKNAAPQIHISYQRNVWNVGSTDQREYHVISVKDNCVGFDMSESEMIFHTFYKVKGNEQKGSGLGLSVCRKIMEKHGGFIQAFSNQEEGTIIQLCFPV